MASRYPVILEWSRADARFIATVPDLPGCFADGATREEAAKNAEAVIQRWVEVAIDEGRAVPGPSQVASRQAVRIEDPGSSVLYSYGKPKAGARKGGQL